MAPRDLHAMAGIEEKPDSVLAGRGQIDAEVRDRALHRSSGRRRSASSPETEILRVADISLASLAGWAESQVVAVMGVTDHQRDAGLCARRRGSAKTGERGQRQDQRSYGCLRRMANAGYRSRYRSWVKGRELRPGTQVSGITFLSEGWR